MDGQCPSAAPIFTEQCEYDLSKSRHGVTKTPPHTLSSKIASLVQQGCIASIWFCLKDTWKDAGICLGLSQVSHGWLPEALRTSRVYEFYAGPFQRGACAKFKAHLIPIGYALLILATPTITRLASAALSRAQPSLPEQTTPKIVSEPKPLPMLIEQDLTQQILEEFLAQAQDCSQSEILFNKNP